MVPIREVSPLLGPMSECYRYEDTRHIVIPVTRKKYCAHGTESYHRAVLCGSSVACQYHTQTTLIARAYARGYPPGVGGVPVSP